MKYIRPDYYEGFRCIASGCTHSCCVGWEIDIDPDSLVRFRRVGGTLGEKLKENISFEGEPHFILGERERCPFLKENGLCELILELGEDSLCDICAEHPRFYNELPGRIEYGVGMCCEEAARLLVSGKEPVKLLSESDGEEDEEEPSGLVLRRDTILTLLNSTGTFQERMEKILLLAGKRFVRFSPAETAEFFLGLERMDEEWTALLTGMKKHPSAPELFERLNEIKYTRIAHYFIFRHFLSAKTEEEAEKLLSFAFLSTMIVCFLDSLGVPEDALRLYSAEIEYSDENIGRIVSALDNGELIFCGNI